MDLKVLLATISQIAEDKNIPQEKVMEALNQALAAAYNRGSNRPENRRA